MADVTEFTPNKGDNPEHPDADEAAQSPAKPPARKTRRSSKSEDDPDFWQRCRERSVTDWSERLLMYCYRMEPVQNTDGKMAFLEKRSGPSAQETDEEYLKQTYGSGKYRCYVTQSQSGGGRSKQIDSVVTTIHHPQHPPKIQSDEWKHIASNSKWIWDPPKDEPDDAETVEAEVQPDDAKKVNEILDIAERLNDMRSEGKSDEGLTLKLLDLLIARQSAGSNQAPQLGDVLGGMAALMTASQKPQASGPADKLMEALIAALPALIAALPELLKRNEPEPAEQRLAATLALVRELKEMAGGGEEARPAKTTWQQDLIQVLPQVGSSVASIVGNIASLPRKPTPAPQNPQQQAQPQPGQQPQPAQIEQPQAQQQPAAPALDPPLTEQEMILANYIAANIAQPLLNHLNNGGDGHEFAAWLLEGYGEAVYGQVKQLGKDSILRAMQGHEQLWAALAPYHGDRIEKFVEQFVAGPDDPDEQPDEDDQEGRTNERTEDPPIQ